MFCTARGTPVMRAGRAEGDVVAALRPMRRVRLLHFHSVQRAFGGFDSEAAADAFGRRVSPLLGKWCCRPHEGRARSGGLAVDELLTLRERGFALAFAPPLRRARARRGGGGGGEHARNQRDGHSCL